MSNEQFVDVIIYWRETRYEARYSITREERDRLIKQFTGGAAYGHYEVRFASRAPETETPRRLALRFADILYIG